jgi:hypothetical protein
MQTEHPGLPLLLNTLLRMDPAVPMVVFPDSVPDGEFEIADVVAALLTVWPAHGGPLLGVSQSPNESEQLLPPDIDLLQVFLQPGVRALELNGFHMTDAQLSRVVAQVRMRGSDLQSLCLHYTPVERLNCPLMAELIGVLPGLESLELRIDHDYADDHTDRFAHDYTLAHGLAGALAGKPLRHLRIHLPGEAESGRLQQLLTALTAALQQAPHPVQWRQVELATFCDDDTHLPALEAWLALLVAAPGTQAITLSIQRPSSDDPARRPTLPQAALQDALRRRTAPLALTVGGATVGDIDRLLGLFMVLPEADRPWVPHPAEAVVPACIGPLELACTIFRTQPEPGASPNDLPGSALLMHIAQTLPRMPHLQRLTLAPDWFEPAGDRPALGISRASLDALERAWRGAPGLRIQVEGRSERSVLLRHAIERPWVAALAWTANAVGLQSVLAPDLNAPLSGDMFRQIARHLHPAMGSDEAGVWGVPMLNRSQLLTTVDTFDALVDDQNRRPRAPGQPTVTQRHRLHGVAELIRRNRGQEGALRV